MKFFLDTASLDDIKHWKKCNLVEGVTTNPTLLSKFNDDAKNRLKKISKIVKGPVSAQVTYQNCEKMVKQGLQLKKISKNIIIKLPANFEGFKAAKILKDKKIKINITVGFEPAQIISFAKINVDYFSLIYGKAEDWGFSNLKSINDTKEILKKINSKTKLLVASLRNPSQLKDAILNGADLVTVPPSTWNMVFNNKYSKLASEIFSKDWKSLSKINKIKYEKL